jgi:hypothetical protein
MKDMFDRELVPGDEVVYCTRHSSSMTQNYAKVLISQSDKARVQPLSRDRQSRYFVDSRTGERVEWLDLRAHYKVPAKYEHNVTGKVISQDEYEELQREYYSIPYHQKPDFSSEKHVYAYRYKPYVLHDYVVEDYDPAKPVWISTPRYVVKLERPA